MRLEGQYARAVIAVILPLSLLLQPIGSDSFANYSLGPVCFAVSIQDRATSKIKCKNSFAIAKLDSLAQMEDLGSVLENTYHLYIQFDQGKFRWADGTEVADGMWQTGVPPVDTSLCGGLEHSASTRLVGVGCSDELYYICRSDDLADCSGGTVIIPSDSANPATTYGTTTRQTQETSTSQPEPDTTTSQPESETTTSQPEPEITTSQPEPETTTSQPEPETTTSQPEPETTTLHPEPQTTTSKPEPETTTSQPEPATTTPQSIPDTTTSLPNYVTTSSQYEQETTATSSEEAQSTTTPSSPQEETSTPQPQRETTTTSHPNQEPVTTQPGTEASSSQSSQRQTYYSTPSSFQTRTEILTSDPDISWPAAVNSSDLQTVINNSSSVNSNVTSLTDIFNVTMPTLSSSTTSSTGSRRCACRCLDERNAENVSSDEAAEQAQALQAYLLLNTTLLSSTVRRKTSAKDVRTSAQVTGTIGVAVLLIVLAVPVAMDISGALVVRKPSRAAVDVAPEEAGVDEEVMETEL